MASQGAIDKTYLFVVLLQSREILTGLREFTFLHTFTHIPVHKGTLGIQKIELVI